MRHTFGILSIASRHPIIFTTMTHNAPMSDSQGEFAEFKVNPNIPCRECGVHAVSVRQWDSSCGGYEDYQYKCATCGHTWWVDGIDS